MGRKRSGGSSKPTYNPNTNPTLNAFYSNQRRRPTYQGVLYAPVDQAQKQAMIQARLDRARAGSGQKSASTGTGGHINAPVIQQQGGFQSRGGK